MSSFEDLQVWQRSKGLAVQVINMLSTSKNYGLKDQMIRSAISIPSNIAEGAERKGQKEFANFISYSSGSCAELMTQIMIAKEINEFDNDKAKGSTRSRLEENHRVLRAVVVGAFVPVEATLLSLE